MEIKYVFMIGEGWGERVNVTLELIE